MNEHDQERISELSDELDRANEKIKCLEADLAHYQKQDKPKPWAPITVFDPEAKQKEANFDSEAVALLRHLKAKGLILVVFSAERGTGISVQLTDPEVMPQVPVILKRMGEKMQRDILMRSLRGDRL
jgi:hypothetical protein